jgi:hypothetical protein
MGKLAVRTDAEDLGSFRREFALPPGELEDFLISDGGEIQCGECREEYEALFTALKRMQEQEESEGRPD